MTQNRFYSSVAVKTSLQVSASAAATTLSVVAATGFPASTPFTVILERDTVSEEVVTVTSVTGTTLTVTRGSDGTAAISHNLGATVEHGVSARDYDEPQAHMASIVAHGATVAVVGTTDTQTLTNKTMSGASNTFSAIPQAAVTGMPAGTVVGTTDVQTMTNKTINGATIDSASTIGGTTISTFTGAWTSWTPTFTNVTSGAGSFAYRLIGKTLYLRGYFTAGTATGAGQITLTLPLGTTISGGRQFIVAADSTTGVWYIEPSDTIVKSLSSFAGGTALTTRGFTGVIEVA